MSTPFMLKLYIILHFVPVTFRGRRSQEVEEASVPRFDMFSGYPIPLFDSRKGWQGSFEVVRYFRIQTGGFQFIEH